MKPRPIIDVDRDAQIVALWQGRPRDQRRLTDIGVFYQWLIDYAPWLVPAGVDFLDQLRTLLHAHTMQDDSPSQPERRPRRPRVPRNE